MLSAAAASDKQALPQLMRGGEELEGLKIEKPVCFYLLYTVYKRQLLPLAPNTTDCALTGD